MDFDSIQNTDDNTEETEKDTICSKHVITNENAVCITVTDETGHNFHKEEINLSNVKYEEDIQVNLETEDTVFRDGIQKSDKTDEKTVQCIDIIAKTEKRKDFEILQVANLNQETSKEGINTNCSDELEFEVEIHDLPVGNNNDDDEEINAKLKTLSKSFRNQQSDDHDEIEVIEPEKVRMADLFKLNASTRTNGGSIPTSFVLTDATNDNSSPSVWRKFMQKLQSSETKYAVSDGSVQKQKWPLMRKTKYGMIFVAVALLLIILLVIAVTTSGSNENESKPPVQMLQSKVYVNALINLKVNQTFQSEYSKLDSPIYQQFTSEFCAEIDKVYNTKEKNAVSKFYYGCKIITLSKGSIEVEFTIYFVDTTTAFVQTHVQDILEANIFNKATGKYMLGRFPIIPNSIHLSQVASISLHTPPEIQKDINTIVTETSSQPLDATSPQSTNSDTGLTTLTLHEQLSTSSEILTKDSVEPMTSSVNSRTNPLSHTTQRKFTKGPTTTVSTSTYNKDLSQSSSKTTYGSQYFTNISTPASSRTTEEATKTIDLTTQSEETSVVTEQTADMSSTGVTTEQTTVVTTPKIPVDGIWTEWSSWSSCDVTCRKGVSIRERNCKEPVNGGKDCIGNNTESVICELQPCPDDGSWSEWTSWSSCSASCGEANRTRVRECDIPKPSGDGLFCEGSDTQTTSCILNGCPIDGGWSEWTTWSNCSSICTSGDRRRFRTCTQPEPQNGGQSCVGDDAESKPCDLSECPADGKWADWSAWTCSITCGSGALTRSRICTGQQNDGNMCAGNSTETSVCELGPCPVDGNWALWTEWSSCNSSCGNDGQTTRIRTCDDPAPSNGGKHCIGNMTESLPCTSNPCSVNGSWSDWSSWGKCSVSCGMGSRSRTRECNNPPPVGDGLFCTGFPKEYTTCILDQCTVIGYWTEWSAWEICSASCGGGETTKMRTCYNQDVQQDLRIICIGNNNETKTCNNQSCPIDGNWSEWTTWSGCSRTCNGGLKGRTRKCDKPKPANNGLYCPGNSSDTLSCNQVSCPGGQCINITTLVNDEMVNMTCSVEGFETFMPMAILHNEQTVATIEENLTVNNTSDSNIEIVIENRVTTIINITLKRVACSYSGMYEIKVDDETFKTVVIIGFLTVHGEIDKPTIYIDDRQLDGLRQPPEFYAHQCSGYVGSDNNQLVLESRKTMNEQWRSIMEDVVIIKNEQYRNSCNVFHNITFSFNLTSAFWGQMIRCRVSGNVIGNNKTHVSNVDLSSFAKNQCTRESKLINTGPAAITCYLNRTTNYENIHIVQYRRDFHRNISEIKNNAVTQNVANIRVSVREKFEITITFDNVSCVDGGDYILLVSGTSGILAEIIGTLIPLKNPFDPILELNPTAVYGSTSPENPHRCHGNVGFPPGYLAVDVSVNGSDRFIEITTNNTFLEIQSNVQNISFDECYGFQSQDFKILNLNQSQPTIIRCRVVHEFTADTLQYSSEKFLQMIPNDICQCNTKDAGIFRGHPSRCDYYVECVNNTTPVGLKCPPDQCRQSLTGICGNNCSPSVCDVPVPKADVLNETKNPLSLPNTTQTGQQQQS